MTRDQAINPYRAGISLTTAALFYGAGRYMKVPNIGRATLGVALAAVAQGMQPLLKNQAGDRTYKNWLLDGASLALIATGMRATKLAARTQLLVGSALFGTQYAITNLRADTLSSRIERMHKGDLKEIEEEIWDLDFDAKRKIELYDAFIAKACTLVHSSNKWVQEAFSDKWDKVCTLEGEENAQAFMKHIELLDRYEMSHLSLFEVEGFEGSAAVQAWLGGKGGEIKGRWGQPGYPLTDELEQDIRAKTPAQGIKLCQELIERCGSNSDAFFKINELRFELIKELAFEDRPQAFKDSIESLATQRGLLPLEIYIDGYMSQALDDDWMKGRGSEILLEGHAFHIKIKDDNYRDLIEIAKELTAGLTSEAAVEVCHQLVNTAWDLEGDNRGDFLLPIFNLEVNYLKQLEEADLFQAIIQCIEDMKIFGIWNLELFFSDQLLHGLKGQPEVQEWMKNEGDAVFMDWFRTSMNEIDRDNAANKYAQLKSCAACVEPTVAIELCQIFFAKALTLVPYGTTNLDGPFIGGVLALETRCMERLEGIEKARAIMSHIEMIDVADINWKVVFGDDWLGPFMDEPEVDAWMRDKGQAIRDSWV